MLRKKKITFKFIRCSISCFVHFFGILFSFCKFQQNFNGHLTSNERAMSWKHNQNNRCHNTAEHVASNDFCLFVFTSCNDLGRPQMQTSVCRPLLGAHWCLHFPSVLWANSVKISVTLENLSPPGFLSSTWQGRQHRHTSGSEKNPPVQIGMCPTTWWYTVKGLLSSASYSSNGKQIASISPHADPSAYELVLKTE